MTLPKTSNQTKEGFTLIEIVISLAILGVIFSLGFFISTNSLARSTITSEKELMVSILMRARSLALSGVENQDHGVCFIDNQYVLFIGDLCQKAMPKNITFEANPEIAKKSNFELGFPIIIFEKNTGMARATTVNISDGTTVEKISINNEGAINW